MKANKCQQSHQGLLYNSAAQVCHLSLWSQAVRQRLRQLAHLWLLNMWNHLWSGSSSCSSSSPFLIPSHLLVLVQKLNCPTMVLNFVVVLRLPTALPLTSGRLVNLAIHCCPRSLLIYFQPRHPRHTLNVCSVSVEIWRQANATEWLLPLNDVYFLKLTRSTCEQTC